MKLCLAFLCCSAAVVFAQRGGWGEWVWQGIRDRYDHRDVIDTLHTYRFVEHKTSSSHLLIAISDNRDHRECFVVEVDNMWTHLLDDHNNVNMIVEEIYHMIIDPNLPSLTITTDNIKNYYHDISGADECQDHRSHLIKYTPSFAPTGIVQSTQAPTNTQPDQTTTNEAPTSTHRVRPIG
ncbi:uncharacterized protein [Littorina saxatilis]|uniref:uncharacterized protein n=1 Tax=Littorina saxatilis TaxID=31220 RepID=UPI0038B4B7B4